MNTARPANEVDTDSFYARLLFIFQQYSVWFWKYETIHSGAIHHVEYTRFFKLISMASIILVSSFCGGARAASSEDITLAAGDILRLDILDDDKEPVDLPIGSDGTIQAPFVGSVAVAGLVITDALQRLERRFGKEKIFLTPKISLAVASYRPIFVVGDVRQPGSYPYQPQLTVQKAVALAGGHIAAATTEDPILARARIRGELDTIDSDIIREALISARLGAQLADRVEILDSDIPAAARPYISGAVAEAFREVEQRILTTDANAFVAKKAAVDGEIKGAEHSFSLLEQLLAKVASSVELSHEDLGRAKGLQQRGLKTLSDVSNLERQVTEEESRQLQVLANLSEAGRNISTLKTEIADLTETRHMSALTDIQVHSSNLTKAIVARKTAETQLALMAGMEADSAAASKEIVLDYRIRRGAGSDLVEVAAKEASPLLPGDLLVVALRTEGDGAAVAALPVSGRLSQQ